jgi:uncharacterized protein YcfJ
MVQSGKVNIMKSLRSVYAKTALALLACTAAGAGFAQTVYAPSTPAPGPEYGRVLSSTAIQTQVTVPRQVCGVEQVVTPAQKSGGGAILGAIAGGAVGNSMGHGSGRAAATAIGIVGGAMLGDRIEGSPSTQVQNVERCVTQHVIEYRTTGYNVVYEYAGRQYSVQMPQDPGQWIKLQVTPVVGGPQSAAPAYAPETMVVRSTTVIQEPAVYGSPVVLAPAVVFGATYVGGNRHYRHHHRHVEPTIGVRLNYGAPGYSRHWY